jgi:hypothetical protein
MSGGFLRILSVAAVAAALTFMVARGCSSSRPRASVRLSLGTTLVARDVSFTIHTGPESRVTLRSLDGAVERDLAMWVVVDGVARSLELARSQMRFEADAVIGSSTLEFGDSTVEASIAFRVGREDDALIAVVSLPPQAEGGHTIGLRYEVATLGRVAFVSGTGALADLGTVSGRFVSIDADPYAIGFASALGALDVSAVSDEGAEQGSPMRLTVTSPVSELGGPDRGVTALRVVVAPSAQKLWGTLYQVSGVVTAHVKGFVAGIGRHARVFGLDEDGTPQVVADVDADGHFALDVPNTVVEWYAALDPARTSSPVHFTPGTPWDLRLDVSPGGDLQARILDPDTGKPITARLLVHGIDGTLDPSFGPDYRASGAGPIIDALWGEVMTPLPEGRYRVAATKGIEWSVDAKTVVIEPGGHVAVDLSPRHVVPTPGVLGADLHVHARPSFDTPVSAEDRVLSLVSAGIDFAVPSEHNIVGDYGPMIATLDLTHELSYVPGVEVTTFTPRFGHFGVFPYPHIPVPPYRATTPNGLFNAAHRGDPTRILQVNHPRLPMAIGYFNVFHYEPQKGQEPPASMRMDFDTIEVFNGYDMAKNERVEAVMHDWFALLNQGYRYTATGSSDSHRIQYQWAGYPRTLIAVGEAASGEKGPVDTSAVVAALKKGHATVTNGPIIELEMEGAHPGDELVTVEDPIRAHIVVRAAPWIDVTSLEIVAGNKTLKTLPIASRPTKLGPELGTREEAEARSVRFDQELSLPLDAANTWVVVVARGTRKLDDVLPFMPTVPLGFTNPVWVTRDPKAVVRRFPKGR